MFVIVVYPTAPRLASMKGSSKRVADYQPLGKRAQVWDKRPARDWK